MLIIRLSRIGKKKQPYYRLTITERHRDPYGRALEILGSYNPRSKKLQAKKERIEYWLNVGAQMTPTVNNLLVRNKVVKGKIIKASRVNKKKAEGKKAEQATPETKQENKEEVKQEA
jgi:small subunit ribosomal protein S16